jgi:hypothetical protein
VALASGIPYRVDDDGLALDDPGLDSFLAGLSADVPPLVALAGASDPIGRSALAWAAPYRTLSDVRTAIDDARARRSELRTNDARLALATVHGTKGLEFDHVAVVGLDDGTFPSRRALEEADAPGRVLEEERRLAYVAWTRARRSLTLVYDPDAPSIFMREAFDYAELAAG